MEAYRTVTEQQHKRRKGYWLYYEQARKSEQDFMRKILLSVIPVVQKVNQCLNLDSDTLSLHVACKVSDTIVR